jgi:hypothetical protein
MPICKHRQRQQQRQPLLPPPLLLLLQGLALMTLGRPWQQWQPQLVAQAAEAAVPLG